MTQEHSSVSCLDNLASHPPFNIIGFRNRVMALINRARDYLLYELAVRFVFLSGNAIFASGHLCWLFVMWLSSSHLKSLISTIFLTAFGPADFFCSEEPVDLVMVPDKNLRLRQDIQQAIYG